MSSTPMVRSLSRPTLHHSTSSTSTMGSSSTMKYPGTSTVFNYPPTVQHYGGRATESTRKVSEFTTVQELPATVNTTTTTIQHNHPYSSTPVVTREVSGPMSLNSSSNFARQISGTMRTIQHSPSTIHYPTTVSHISSGSPLSHSVSGTSFYPTNSSPIAPTATPIPISSSVYATTTPFVRRQISNPLVSPSPISSPLVYSRQISGTVGTSGPLRQYSGPIRQYSGPIRQYSGPLRQYSAPRQVSSTITRVDTLPSTYTSTHTSTKYPSASTINYPSVSTTNYPSVSTVNGLYRSTPTSSPMTYTPTTSYTTTPATSSVTHHYPTPITSIMGSPIPYTYSPSLPTSTITSLQSSPSITHLPTETTVNTYTIDHPTITFAQDGASFTSTNSLSGVLSMDAGSAHHSAVYEPAHLKDRRPSGPHLRSETFHALKKVDPLTSAHNSEPSSRSSSSFGSDVCDNEETFCK